MCKAKCCYTGTVDILPNYYYSFCMPRNIERSPVLILPDMTKISEGVMELIGNVTLGNVDGLKVFLRPESFRVSLSNSK